jgi:hypothetical protein
MEGCVRPLVRGADEALGAEAAIRNEAFAGVPAHRFVKIT